MIIIGASSGTSADGLDLGAAEFTLDGDTLRARLLGAATVDLPDSIQERYRNLLPPAAVPVMELCRLDTAVGQAIADAVAEHGAELTGGCPIDLVASHGQTVFHDVVDGSVRGTLQVGQPAWIAERTGLPVVSDLRVADVAAGGQGAPLAVAWDALWLADTDGTVGALNLGGIANVTLLGDHPVAFDTGPANALLDAAIAVRTQGREHVDRDGATAARGRVDDALLGRLLADPYFSRPAPKSTGREYFTWERLTASSVDDVSTEDLLATLTELTARTVAEAVADRGLTELVASGGGVHNRELMRRLASHLGSTRLTTSADRGVPVDDKESYLFALIGFLAWHRIPLPISSATGATGDRIAGRFTPGRDGLELPPAERTCPRRMIVHDASH